MLRFARTLGIARGRIPHSVTFLRFVALGAWNAVWSFALFALLIEIADVQYLLALAIVWTIGFIANYVANFLWVFRTGSRLRFRYNLPRYVVLFWGSFGLNLTLLYLLTDILRMTPLLAQFILVPPIVMLNFVGGRVWAFRANS